MASESTDPARPTTRPAPHEPGEQQATAADAARPPRAGPQVAAARRGAGGADPAQYGGYGCDGYGYATHG